MAITDKRLYIWVDAATYGRLVELAHKHDLSLNNTILRCIHTAHFPSPVSRSRLSPRRIARNEHVRVKGNAYYHRKKKVKGA
jgi:hypothetical protein